MPFCLESGLRRLLFSSEDAFEWTVSTAERQLTYPEDSPQDNNTYVVDSSAEDDIDIEVS